MAFKLKPHVRGSKTRKEQLKTAARDNYNKRRAKKAAAPTAAPAPKPRPAAAKKAAPKTSPKPMARPGKASTGGPARHKTSKASTGGPARHKASKPKAKRQDPPTQGKRIRDKVKSFFSGGSKSKNTKKVKNPRAYIGARNDKKK